ncbi:hypothetical protein GCM10007989_02130 [Devosia pacifica]|uniref:Uncharacterized protein n=1 Tax=Devosia pacifica TaxID=1335967 RepID=A0A918RT86_9HYPH|nr:hypothetical protein GCM10007989_02130 [Devosia pacifica]
MSDAIQIHKVWHCASDSEVGVVARWKARVGDWTIWHGAIRRDNESILHVVMPGRGSCGISLSRESETWRDLEAAVLSAWQSGKLR